MTSRLIRILSFVLATLLASVPSYPQQPTRMPRVGLVMPGPQETSVEHVDEFRQGLQDLGYIDGRNIEIDVRWHPAERPDLILEAVNEMIRAKPNILVGPTTPHILALKQATSTIPIVMITPGDPVGTGLVQSLARPGGNITGLSIMQRDIMGKRLQLLKDIFPQISRVAMLWNPTNPAAQREFKVIEAAAQNLGIALHSAEMRGPSDLVAAFSSITRSKAEAVIVQSDQVTWVQRKQIANLAIQNRLPTLHYLREFVRRRWSYVVWGES